MHAPARSRTPPRAPICARALPYTPARSRTLPHAPIHSRTLPSAPIRSSILPYPPAPSHTLPQGRFAYRVARSGRSQAPARSRTFPHAPTRSSPHALVGSRAIPHALQDDVAQELTQAGPGRSFQKLSISQSIYELKDLKLSNVGVRRYSICFFRAAPFLMISSVTL